MSSLASAQERRESPAPLVDLARAAHFGLTQALYDRFQRLIYDETGIWLSESKKALLAGRLSRRLRALQLSTLKEYYQLIIDPSQQDERVLMIDAITTNETHFFREPRHFEFLGREILPVLRVEAEQHRRPRKVRAWSAGCSSGEEAYSIAMLLANHLPPQEGWDVQVLASDISTRMLEKARTGTYNIAAARDIPKPLLHRFALKGISGQAGKMKMGPEVREMVSFKRINLCRDPYPVETHFDFIFCRNVLIYFDKNSKRKVVESLAQRLSPEGLLLIGHAENLNGITSSVRSLASTIYCRTETHTRVSQGFRKT